MVQARYRGVDGNDGELLLSRVQKDEARPVAVSKCLQFCCNGRKGLLNLHAGVEGSSHTGYRSLLLGTTGGLLVKMSVFYGNGRLPSQCLRKKRVTVVESTRRCAGQRERSPNPVTDSQGCDQQRAIGRGALTGQKAGRRFDVGHL